MQGNNLYFDIMLFTYLTLCVPSEINISNEDIPRRETFAQRGAQCWNTSGFFVKRAQFTGWKGVYLPATCFAQPEIRSNSCVFSCITSRNKRLFKPHSALGYTCGTSLVPSIMLTSFNDWSQWYTGKQEDARQLSEQGLLFQVWIEKQQHLIFGAKVTRRTNCAHILSPSLWSEYCSNMF